MRRRLVSLLLSAVAAGCTTSAGASDPVAPGPAPSPVLYAAVGASETAGVGTRDPSRDAWPRVLWRTELEGAVLFDFGVPGSTVEQALVEQVPEAVAVGPDVVTVWLNVNDLIDGVPARRFERRLSEVVGALARGGRSQVFVANVPVLTGLPLYLACRPDPPPDGPGCPIGDALPGPEVIAAATEAYNRAIARVADRFGATVVDLHGLGDLASVDPSYVSEDGFHPSTEGARLIAGRFAAAIAMRADAGGA
ncbi:MAG TPA: SGNH/GDSL hydrolase family protein [Actinomycetota bacterium]